MITDPGADGRSRATGKKTVAKKTAAQKTAAQKLAAKKTAAKKTAAKKTAAQNLAAQELAAKKTAAKKTAAKPSTKRNAAAANKTTAKSAQEKQPVPHGDRPFKDLPGGMMTEALGESFLLDLIQDWQQNGAGVIELCRTTKPEAYLRLVAAYAPKEFRKTIEPFEGMSDDALKRQLADTLVGLKSLGFDPGPDPGPRTGASPDK